jgi:hypothetical protein
VHTDKEDKDIEAKGNKKVKSLKLINQKINKLKLVKKLWTIS